MRSVRDLVLDIMEEEVKDLVSPEEIAEAKVKWAAEQNQEQKLYKLKHKPSGLFYRPGNGFEEKINLSKRGKTYKKAPAVNRFKDVDGKWKESKPSDWELVEVSIKAQAQDQKED